MGYPWFEQENFDVHAHKLKVTIPKDHRIELRLPEDFPAGPAEVIVLAHPVGSEPQKLSSAQERALANLEELRSLRLTQEEEEVLDQFESFRREHPFHLSSLTDED